MSIMIVKGRGVIIHADTDQLQKHRTNVTGGERVRQGVSLEKMNMVFRNRLFPGCVARP